MLSAGKTWWAVAGGAALAGAFLGGLVVLGVSGWASSPPAKAKPPYDPHGGHSGLQTPLAAPTSEPTYDPAKFDYGKVSKLADGRTLREFTLIAQDREIEIADGIKFPAWTFNGTVPGPALRVTEGDLVRVKFMNEGKHPHTVHFHSIHPADMDGVFEVIPPGGTYTYEFTAEPFGLFLYHCHVNPVSKHVTMGMYGAFIIDPQTPRPPAKELVMVMNGYDIDYDSKENEFYTVNGRAFEYMKRPLEIRVGEPVRIYLLNMTEFDLVNNFHIHGNVFKLYRTGTSLTPHEITDIVTLAQGERAIVEFTYKYPGRYMFHAHINEFTERGWAGLFNVVEAPKVARAGSRNIPRARP